MPYHVLHLTVRSAPVLCLASYCRFGAVAQVTERVSVATNGTPSNGASTQSAICADGRFVVFKSKGGNLASPTVGNSYNDVYLRDRAFGTTTRLTVAPDGSPREPVQDNEDRVSISADGRYVTFASRSNNLVPNDRNITSDIFVRDVWAGSTRLVSITPDGTQSNGDCGWPQLSADGRYIVFTSMGTTLSPDHHFEDVYWRDLQTGEMRLVSAETTETVGHRNAWAGSISGDGRFVAYWSSVYPAVETQLRSDLFLKDMQTGLITKVTRGVNGEGADAVSSDQPALSADGRLLVFDTPASNLVPEDGDNYVDVFLYDRSTDQLRLVSIADEATGTTAHGSWASLSADGRFIANSSLYQVYVRNLATGASRRVNVSSDGIAGNASAGLASLSADGTFVSFFSRATNLVPNDINGVYDVFVHGPAYGSPPLTMADAITALRAAAGLSRLTPAQALRLDAVGPGTSRSVDIQDAIYMVRMVNDR